MERIVNSCPHCGSYDIKNNQCNDCKREFKTIDNKIVKKQREQSIYTLENYKGNSSIFFISREGILDDNYQLLSKTKLKIVINPSGNRKITTQFGMLEFYKEKPDEIEINDSNGTNLAQISMINKDLFLLSYQKKLYKMDKIVSFPFNVYATTGESILTIDDNPGGYSKKLGVIFPSYRMLSSGKIEHNIALLLMVFIYYFYTFNLCLKPIKVASISVKKGITGILKFYDSNDNFIAKTAHYNIIWWVIGIFTWIFVIGIFITTYLIIQTIRNGKLVSQSGEVIGKYKSTISKRIIECKVPSRSLIGTIDFKNDLIRSNKNALTGTVTGSDGNFNIKALTILEDQNHNTMFSIFGFNNDFKIVLDKQYDSYKACLISVVIINKYLIPKNNSIAL